MPAVTSVSEGQGDPQREGPHRRPDLPREAGWADRTALCVPRNVKLDVRVSARACFHLRTGAREALAHNPVSSKQQMI